ncbi:MAG: copper homeostasis protein CutC [Flavobacteriaceae bacterium]|nr:copper homeostasis protein CutC [Bacteroidia bacterium]NNF74318.1 copper homeostasis protein CutC [Flavobacteriaceae bacterium]
MKLEVCAATIESALNAQAGEADRIELCRDLYLDGLTPRKKTIKTVLKRLDIPVFILVRPRSGNFVYSEMEFNRMLETIEFVKSAGCHGIVSGVLNLDNSIDIKRTAKLVDSALPLPFTFHRAFDLVNDKQSAAHSLGAIGVKRILTSGGKARAIDGLDSLKSLQEAVGNKLIIMPGGGLRPEQVNQFKESGFKELHSSARPIEDHVIKSIKIHSDRSVIAAFKREMFT